MMKRIAPAVRHIGPNDAIAMLKETSRASGMEMDMIDTHVIRIIVSKFFVLRLRLITSYIMCLMLEGNKN